jgi:hypothetical protein
MLSIAMGDSPPRERQLLEPFSSLIQAVVDQIFNLDILKSIIYQKK